MTSSSPAVFNDAEYKPYHYDRAYPLYEVRPTIKLTPDIFQQRRLYMTAAEKVTVMEIVNFNKQGEVVLLSQKLYAEGRKNKPNWKMFDKDGLCVVAKMRYDAQDGQVKDGVYTLSDRDGIRIAMEYKGGSPNGGVTTYYPDKSFEKTTQVKGVKQGQAYYHVAEGTVNAEIEEYCYKDGVVQGQASKSTTKGGIEYHTYVDGIKQGKAYKEDKFHGRRSLWYVDGSVEGLTCYIDEHDRIVKYLVCADNVGIYSFSPDPNLPYLFDKTATDIAVPARDIKTLYAEVLDTMMRHKVKEDDIIDVGLRLQPLMEVQG